MSQLPPEGQAVLDRPISDLNLSVRARKCMVRLGLTTIGELIRKTGDDLLECKNFGVTSLNEVREKLTRVESQIAWRLMLGVGLFFSIAPNRIQTSAARARHFDHAREAACSCRHSCRWARRERSKG